MLEVEIKKFLENQKVKEENLGTAISPWEAALKDGMKNAELIIESLLKLEKKSNMLKTWKKISPPEIRFYQ